MRFLGKPARRIGTAKSGSPQGIRILRSGHSLRTASAAHFAVTENMRRFAFSSGVMAGSGAFQ